MIRTDAPVRTDKFDYDEDEHLTIGEFESKHVLGDWFLASTKLESAWIYALLVNGDELDELQESASGGRGMKDAGVAAYLDELEMKHIACPSRRRPPDLQTSFSRVIPGEDTAVRISPFAVIRKMDRKLNGQILMVDYVNGRSLTRPSSDYELLTKVAKEPLRPETPALRRQVEKLRRFGILQMTNDY